MTPLIINDMKNQNDIVFDLGQDNRPLLEHLTKDNIDSTLFANQYNYALSQIDQYIKSINERESQTVLKKVGIDNNNNIFAFLGDRGTGKTSCMISVADLLTSENIKEFDQYRNLKNTAFTRIGLIDPSYFDDQHNVISLFLAKLYNEFTTEISNRRKNYYDDIDFERGFENECHDFLNKLSRTQKHLMCLLTDKGRDEDDTEESLTWLSSSIDLREDIKRLVDSFNTTVKKKKGAILVLEIDDIDLNFSQAAKMAEQIRKYFIQPNVVVLMSLNLQQMTAIKMNEIREEYKNLSEDKKEYDSKDMALKYLNKLIPQSQRIYMPNAESFTYKGLVIESDGQEPKSYTSIRQAVPQLIFNKSRYLFYNTSVSDSFIVPHNLRDLRQLIKLLYVLPDYNKNNPESTTYNKAVFKDYFSSTWAINYLDDEQRNYVLNVLNARDFAQVNNLVWEGLIAIKDIVPVQMNRKGYLTTGDIIAIITIIEQDINDTSLARYLFALKTSYSIKLYEAYDSITEGNTFDNSRDHSDKEIYRDSSMVGIDDYTSLSYGKIFNTRYTPLIYSRLNNIDFNVSLVDRSELVSLFDLCKNLIDTAKQEKSLEKVIKMSPYIKLLELLMFGIRFSRPENENNLYSEIGDNDTMTFDLGCFFYNIMHFYDDGKWSCYKRFENISDSSKEVIDFITTDDNHFVKLWPCFVLRAIEKEREKETHNKGEISHEAYKRRDFTRFPAGMLSSFKEDRWLSACSFRNFEIMQDFIHYFKNVEYDPQNFANSYYIFFKKMSEYCRETYDTKSSADKNYYIIRFYYALDLADVLKYNGTRALFNKVLNRENLANTTSSDSSTVASGTTR